MIVKGNPVKEVSNSIGFRVKQDTVDEIFCVYF